MHLIDSLNDVIYKLNNHSQDPIKYLITFSDQRNPPQISKIEVNGREICSVGKYCID
jgi:hypothetical protein